MEILEKSTFLGFFLFICKKLHGSNSSKKQYKKKKIWHTKIFELQIKQHFF